MRWRAANQRVQAFMFDRVVEDYKLRFLCWPASTLPSRRARSAEKRTDVVIAPLASM
jgi:hypothetical protein